MHTTKQDVRDLLDQLPDDSTIEDIQYHLYVLEKIHRGQEDRAGPTPLNNHTRSDKWIPVGVVKRPWAVAVG